MQLRHLKTIQPPAEMQEGKFQKISAFAWSPNHLRLAAAGQDRYIVLYDENGEQKDKFPTKPAEKKGSRNYVIRSLEFSPDSTRLAVAQSDCIVFVYKLGTSWTDKKTISNKFPQLAPVTCMCWPSQRFGELVYGCSDGKIGVGKIKTNRSQILYSHESYCVGMAASPDGNSFVTAFLDGSIIKFTFPPSDTGSNPLQTTLVQTNFVPSVLSWGEHIVVAGNTGKVLFYNSNNGRNVQTFDYSDDLKLKEFTSAAASPSGQTMILGNFNRFFVYVYNMQRDGWDEAGVTTIQNFYSVTGLRWKCDGSRLVTGSLCGAIDMYDACIRRFIYAQKFEFTYTSLSTVIIRRLQNSTETSISSRYGLEIKKIDIYSDRYLVAKTPDTLLLCDTETKKLSEIHWTGSGKEKYFFDTPSACLIFNAGELSVVEYGSHEILGHCSTVHMSPHLISVRLGEARNKDEKDAKKIAYLLDSLTIRLLDLTEKSASEVTISHDSKIDWLELNQRGTKLLFRDKRRTLHLFDALTQTRKTLLNFCNYVQWVPDADVVVAQSRRNLYCWYSIESTSDVVITPIKGDIEEIERSDGKTEVIVDEGIDHASYRLDETLISFGAAADAKNFQKCVSVLESLGEGATNLTSMWEQLANLAKANNDFAVSQRCAAALGNMGLTYALSKVNETILASGGDTKSVDCLAQVAILNQQFKRAENILVQQGKVNAAIMMYLRFHKWEEAMIVAQSNHHPRLSQIRNAYFQYLVKTKQANVAGELKEKEGEYSTALRLYLSEGYPTKAADLVIAQDMTDDTNLCQNVAQALLKQKAFEKAGHFYDTLRFHQQALDAYVKGHCYTQALDLARRAFPGEVVRLEQEFGDWLVSHKQMDAACNHYIQAGAYLKAINAAIEARQWVKAVQIIDQMDSTSAKPYYKRIAKHYVEVKDYENAERYFIQGNLPVEAVTMYTTAQMWDKAHQIASTYMPPAEVTRVYVTLAQDLEARGTAQAKDAERLYLTVKEPDLAISMYKRNRQYDDMLRLIESNRKELLEDTHMHLGNQYEIEGNFKQAEQHFLRANDWKAAVNMYRENELWEDCLRVAKARGGDEAYKQMAYAFAMSVGGDQGAKILQKRGLAEHAVDYAIDRGEFTEAFNIATRTCKHKLQDVHLQYALALEDDERFEKAEEEFLAAKKPKEAIAMWVHQQDWNNAMRVAEAHDPSAMLEIWEDKGRKRLEVKDWAGAETCFVNAKKPEESVKAYKNAALWEDALRVARTHAPRLVGSLIQEQQQHAQRNPVLNAGPLTIDALLREAKMLEQQQNFAGAIQKYLTITREHTSNLDQLERAWQSAALLAIDHISDNNQVKQIITTISKRLSDIGRHEAAANLWMDISAYKEAIDVYTTAGMFEKAREVAQKAAPQYVKNVNEKLQEHLMANQTTNAATNSVSVGALAASNPGAAIEVLIKRGQWDRVYELAEKQGLGSVQRYLIFHATSLMKDDQFLPTLKLFHQRGMPVMQEHFSVYHRLCVEVFALSEGDEKQKKVSAAVLEEAHQQLRDILFKFVAELIELDPHGSATKGFERFLLIAHILATRSIAKQNELNEIYAKQSVAMLRYTVELPVDVTFYEAGDACKANNMTGMAFIFLNRFSDICDVIEDPNSGDIENSDFLRTDVPAPTDVPLPADHNLTDAQREEVSDFLISMATSASSIKHDLPTRPCNKCNADTYAASLKCHACPATLPCCIVSGYPVIPNQQVQCRSCHRPANRREWNAWVTKVTTCPWCKSRQLPNYT